MYTLYKFHFLNGISEINQLFDDILIIWPAPVYCLTGLLFTQSGCTYQKFRDPARLALTLHVCRARVQLNRTLAHLLQPSQGLLNEPWCDHISQTNRALELGSKYPVWVHL